MKTRFAVSFFLTVVIALVYSLPLFAQAQTAAPRFIRSTDRAFSKIGVSQLIKTPYRILEKWGNSLDSRNSGTGVGSESVVVSDVYDLSAETTG